MFFSTTTINAKVAEDARKTPSTIPVPPRSLCFFPCSEKMHRGHGPLLPGAAFIPAEWVKSGAIVIEVAMNRNEAGKLVGDIDFEAARERPG